jgi:hypothetical protein
VSSVNGNDRVTNKQLYDELGKLPSRREMYLVVTIGGVLGGVVAKINLLPAAVNALGSLFT